MSYTRDRSFRSGFRCFGSGPAAYPYTTLFPFWKQIRRKVVGELNPYWRTQVENHQNATTAFSGEFSSITTKRGYVHVRGHAGSVQAEHIMRGDLAAYAAVEPVYSGAWSSKAGARAASDFLQDVRKAQVQWSGPTFLGEMKEAVRMFTHPINALERGVTDYLAAVKKANRENRRRYFNKKPAEYSRNLSHIASGLWLEYAFGWVPFLRDIADSRDAYNSLFDKDEVKMISGSGKDLWSRTPAYSTTSVLPTFTSPGYLTERYWEVEIFRYKGAVLHRAATTAADRFARYGFTPSEFFPTAWELLPWSFLIDYFVNIGDLINAAVTSTADVKWCCRTVIHEAVSERTLSWSRQSIAPGWGSWVIDAFDTSPSVSLWKRRTVSRGVSAAPSPNIRLSYPRSDKRLLNVASLLAQVGIGLHPQKLSSPNYRLDLRD